jgi:type I restriction enzyme S subunit
MPRGDKDAIMRYEVPDLPLNIQIRIGNMLSILDSRIANNTKTNHHLEQIAQAIFKSWFVDFEPWGGVMPDNWQNVEFSSFLTPRVEKSNDPAIPLFSVTDKGIFPRSEKFNKVLSKVATMNKIIRQADLVFGMSREILNWGVMRVEIGSVSSAYNVFAVDESINSRYLESFIKSHSIYFKDLIRPATREGQGVDKGVLFAKSMYLPSDKVLAEYYAIEAPLIGAIRNCSEIT